MPGLSQLKEFSENIRNLGNEVEIRGKRGEKVTEVPFPDTYEEDDSDEFLVGMPEKGRDDENLTEDSGETLEDVAAAEDAEELSGEELSPLEDLSGDDALGLDDSSMNLDFDTGSMEDLNDFMEDNELSSINTDDAETIPETETADVSDSAPVDSFDSMPEMDDLPQEINMNEGLPPEISEIDSTPETKEETEPAMPAADELDLSGFEMPEFDSGAAGSSDDLSGSEPAADDSSDIMNEFSMDPVEDIASDSGDMPAMEDSAATPEEAVEAFDVSDIENLDFNADAGADSGSEKKSGGEEFPTTEDGFDLYSDFEIEGFTDTETAEIGKKKTPDVDTVDFSKNAPKPKNSLTDEEYAQFKENLNLYPLNLKIALEEFFTDSEFTDEVTFEIIEKVLAKTSARQLAGQLEKLTEKPISIPRDFERRSYAQYEAYKRSFQYQLKNRIIPGAIIALIAIAVGIGLFKAGVRFIYRPAMATKYYKQGIALIENNEFPQSELKFKEAVSYKPIKKWFFEYAHGYRDKRQYERAAKMYKNILNYFNHDKRGGLEYAEMEAYDLANYAMAENIVKREVLDYYVNDADGILLLGDIYMEWGENLDPQKFEEAKEKYMLLTDLYGTQNLYQARMLRYYIYTDKLRDVLVYKNIFYPNQKSLEAADWTLLSGYLLEKLYGPLSKNDEYLRSSIEDVRGMLEMAIKSDGANPVARYNFAKYFVYNGYIPQAKSEFEIALNLFGKQKRRNKKDTYKEINASRMLGEIYSDGREYLKAQEIFVRGIDLFNEEKARSGFEGDENTGILFADMGNIDYFITGDLDSALKNFETAINTKYDIPDLRYKIGAISYGRKDYDKALDYFVDVANKRGDDTNLLLALGNTLSIRGDNFAAQSYYEDLLDQLDVERGRMGVLSPQDKDDEYDIVDSYLKANNNLGVTLYRLAKQTGNSALFGRSITKLSESNRAWDALTRNQKTMIRLEGSNLAAQNIKYITHPVPEFEPSIYPEISRILVGEKVLN